MKITIKTLAPAGPSIHEAFDKGILHWLARLIQNITKGQRWLALILRGTPVSEIAHKEDISIRRVQDITNLALIAPDIIDAVSLGTQPNGLTANYLIKTSFPADWSKQHDQFATL